MSKIFYKDSIDNVNVKYDELFNDLSLVKSYGKYCKTRSYYEIFKS